MDTAVLIKNLAFKYDNDLPLVLENLNAKFDYGQISLLTGYSGCGKSTILYLISKIIPHIINGVITGDIFINGQNTQSQSIGDISRQVGCVVQNPEVQIINHLVEDEIAFGCENLGFLKSDIKEKISNYASLMKLNLSEKTRNLSGGEKERLILASVLAMNQKILLLDEPLANLDQQSIKIVIDSLVTLKNKGYCIIIAEHRLDYLKDVINQCFVLEDKRLVKTNIASYIKTLTQSVSINTYNKNSSIILSADNIGRKYYKKCVLNNISFSINKGENVLILGDNGCGKTTLLKVIGRLLKPHSGKITQNIDPSLGQKKRASKKWFRQVGYIFQNPNYQLFMPSVIQELKYSNVDNDYLEYLISELGLKPLLKSHPQALSEGQKRRLTVASVLAAKPKLLLLDEPTVGQDNENLDRLIKVLLDYQKRFDATIISVSHDYRYAYSLSNKVIIIEKDKQCVIGGKELIEKYFKVKENK